MSSFINTQFRNFYDFAQQCKQAGKNTAIAKMVVTVKIPNAPDANLPGDKMPDFEITDFTQELMEIE